MPITDPHKRFTHAYILGGSPCSGKSTVAERLSAEFGLTYYKVDDLEQDHLRRCDPDRHPTMHRYATMSWNEIWMRPVAEQVEEEFAFYRERLDMILQDLAAYDGDEPLLLEGAAFLPELVAQLGTAPNRVLFVVPTDAFQRHHYSQRPWIRHILETCEDPEQAFENWMARDHGFGQAVLRQARDHGYGTLKIDGTLSPDEVFARVSVHFGLA